MRVVGGVVAPLMIVAGPAVVAGPVAVADQVEPAENLKVVDSPRDYCSYLFAAVAAAVFAVFAVAIENFVAVEWEPVHYSQR